MKIRGRGRTPEERIVDKLLVLYTTADAGYGIGDTVLQKLTFLSTLEMKKQGHKGFNYSYIKLDYGPYSTDLKNDITELEKTNVITQFSHTVGPLGRYILNHFSQVFDQNPYHIKKIKQVNKKYAGIPRNELVHLVHKMRNPERSGITIQDTRPKSYILKRPQFWSEDKEFKISEVDIASLEIYLNPTNLHALTKSIRESKSNPSVKLSDILNGF